MFCEIMRSTTQTKQTRRRRGLICYDVLCCWYTVDGTKTTSKTELSKFGLTEVVVASFVANLFRIFVRLTRNSPMEHVSRRHHCLIRQNCCNIKMYISINICVSVYPYEKFKGTMSKGKLVSYEEIHNITLHGILS